MAAKGNVEQLVGDNVRGFREQLDISQEKLAEYAEVHRTFVGRIERAELSMSIGQLWKLGQALGIDPSLLLVKNSYKTHQAKRRK